MALVLADRVRETSLSVGTGTITLAGAYPGFQSFTTGIGTGNTTYYTIANLALGEWEVGLGTYTAAGTTLARTTVLSSSTGGSLINFSAGTKDVFVTQPAARAVYLDTATHVTLPAVNLTGTLSGGGNQLNNVIIGASTPLAGNFTNLAYTGTLTGNGGVINIGSGQIYKDASGNLGIGTSSPVGRLNIAAADTSNVIGSAGASLNITNTDIGALGRTVNLNFTVGNGNLTDRRLAGISAIYTSFGTTTAGALAFATDNGSGSFAERARIDSSGNFGIGTSSPSASAILDAQSTTKGVRMPNMTTTQKNAISSPAAGLMVFDTTLAKLCVYTGAVWETITSI